MVFCLHTVCTLCFACIYVCSGLPFLFFRSWRKVFIGKYIYSRHTEKKTLCKVQEGTQEVKISFVWFCLLSISDGCGHRVQRTPWVSIPLAKSWHPGPRAAWRHSFEGGTPLFLPGAFELGGGRVCTWKERQGFLFHAKQALRSMSLGFFRGDYPRLWLRITLCFSLFAWWFTKEMGGKGLCLSFITFCRSSLLWHTNVQSTFRFSIKKRKSPRHSLSNINSHGWCRGVFSTPGNLALLRSQHILWRALGFTHPWGVKSGPSSCQVS